MKIKKYPKPIEIDKARDEIIKLVEDQLKEDEYNYNTLYNIKDSITDILWKYFDLYKKRIDVVNILNGLMEPSNNIEKDATFNRIVDQILKVMDN